MKFLQNGWISLPTSHSGWKTLFFKSSGATIVLATYLFSSGNLEINSDYFCPFTYLGLLLMRQFSQWTHMPFHMLSIESAKDFEVLAWLIRIVSLDFFSFACSHKASTNQINDDDFREASLTLNTNSTICACNCVF